MSNVIKLGNYKGIEVCVQKHLVTDEEVEQQIQGFMAQQTSLEPKEGKVENGDVTTIDFEGFKDGEPFDGGKAEGYQLEIGSGSFIPGFEDQMVGMEKGETRDLNLTFPENYGAADLAGKAVVFKVTVHEISTKKQAELTDEFIKGLGVPEVNNVEDLKAQMRLGLQQQHDQTYNSQKENAIFGQIINNSEVEVTDEEIEEALNKHIERIQIELAGQGMQLEQYLQRMGTDQDNLRKQLEPSAKQQAIFEAIIDEIVRQENIEISEEELNQQIDAIASYNQISAEDVLKQVNKEDLKRDYSRIKASQIVINAAVEK